MVEAMTDDIVSRLRAGELVDCGLIEQYALEAADEIERLRKELEIYKDLYASEIVQKAVRR